MLVVFSGLPGTGKTTLAQFFARQRHAVYLGSDTIDLALRSVAAISGDSRPIVYGMANALAAENLRLAQIVVIDCVNDHQTQRDAWRGIAAAANTPIFEIEMICSDVVEHKRRVEARPASPEGLIPPTWQDVVERAFDPWDRAHLVLDSSKLALAEAYEVLSNWLRRVPSNPPESKNIEAASSAGSLRFCH